MSDSPTGIARHRRLAAAFAGGLLVAFSLPPWGYWPLAFFGVAVFGVALDGAATSGQRAATGFAFGAAWMYVGLVWMWFLTVPGYIVAAALFAALHAGATLLAPTGTWRVLGRPAAHTLAEIVRITIPFGGVPLAGLGISEAGGPLLGVARLGGATLLTWIVFQLGFAVAAGVQIARVEGSHAPARLTQPILVTIASLVVVSVATMIAPTGNETGRSLTVAAVQGGGEQGTRALDVPSSVVTRRLLEATRTIAPSDDLDLVVWPENGIDVNDAPFAGSEAARAVAAEAARLDVPFAVGVTIDSEFSAYPAPDSFVNAQVVVTPDGEVTSSYEKVHIVPFGEYVPFRGALEALGAPVDQIAKDAIRGRDPAVIELPDGTELGVMISYEVFFGDRARDGADGALLLNPTNGASYTWTIVQTQQIAASKLRAVETGRWVVQVSPTGFTAFISPDGEVFQRTDVSEQRVITMAIPLRQGTTLYTSTGDRPWQFAVVALVVLAWFGSRAPRLGRRRTTGVTV